MCGVAVICICNDILCLGKLSLPRFAVTSKGGTRCTQDTIDECSIDRGPVEQLRGHPRLRSWGNCVSVHLLCGHTDTHESYSGLPSSHLFHVSKTGHRLRRSSQGRNTCGATVKARYRGLTAHNAARVSMPRSDWRCGATNAFASSPRETTRAKIICWTFAQTRWLRSSLEIFHYLTGQWSLGRCLTGCQTSDQKRGGLCGSI